VRVTEATAKLVASAAERHTSGANCELVPDRNEFARVRVFRGFRVRYDPARKAKRKDVAVRFDRGFADELPYGDATFDRVFSSMMFHHVPRRDRAKVLEEIRRVLKPGGRLEFLDIAPAGEDRMLGRLHEAGFGDVRKVGERRLVFGRIAFHQARR
jgi:SAM-dependent methyltransferase